VRIGNYTLAEPIGRGGMGEVWRAEHLFLDRDAAIKLMKPGAGSSARPEEVRARFEREARATSSLRSPHTVQLYDYGLGPDGSFYYVMEMLSGCSLEELVARTGPVPAARAVRLLHQICDSLEEAHRLGIIHRDIKPSNLMLCRHGLRHDVVKVLDFGLVKLTDDGEVSSNSVIGTPAYIAPEIAHQSPEADRRSDLYSLACVAYWLLTGETVFQGKNAVGLLLAHASEAPVPPSRRTNNPISRDLEAVVLRCLGKDPASRFGSAAELATELASITVPGRWSEEDAETWWDKHRPDRWQTGFSPPTSATRLSPITTPAPPPTPSVAVLPFENRGGDPARDYFCDGIAEEVITDLSRLSGLLVISRNSSFGYRDPSLDVRRVCKELGVRYAVTGGVSHAGSRVRVHAHLIDGASGTQLWAERYDRELTDIFEVQDDVSRRIVAALRLTLSGDEDHRLGQRGTSNLEAYDAYLRGRDALLRVTPDGCRTARHHFLAAAHADPAFAGAWAGLALAGGFEFSRRWTTDAAGTLADARDYAERALAADDADPIAHACAGAIALWSGDLHGAVASARRSLELDPNNIECRIVLQSALHRLGRNEEALAVLHEVVERDPHFPMPVYYYLGQVYFALGAYREAASCLRRRLAQDPGAHEARRLLVATLGHLGASNEAAAEYNLLEKGGLAYEREILVHVNNDYWPRVDAGIRAAGLSPV
jgi:serine/threonine protein kinase/tetratricopeptide (TPR) repeat protein